MSKYPGRIVTDLAPAGYSVFFDGTDDYLSVADNVNLRPGAGTFTLEAWIYRAAAGAAHTIYAKGGASTGIVFQVTSTNVLRFTHTTTNIDSTGTIAATTWVHVAVVREGTGTNQTKLYINGVQDGQGTVSTDFTETEEVRIGTNRGATEDFSGNISNLRFVKGSAVYTAVFTPPTQLFNITNTSLLTCNSPAIIDQSNNAFAITTNGDARVSTFTPFTAYVPYNPALGASTPGVWTVDEAMQARQTRQWNMYDPRFNLTTLLLHGNGTNGAQNNTFLDSSSNNFTITRNGNTTQGSFSPYGSTWSFSATAGSDNTDFVSTPASANLRLDQGNWTLEFWLFVSGWNTNNRCFDTGTNGSGAAMVIQYFSTGQISFGTPTAGTGVATPTGVIQLGKWYHVALTSEGAGLNGRIYIDGVLSGGPNNYTNPSATAPAFNIGRNNVNAGDWSGLIGYMSNFRFVSGQRLYTTNFVPQTTPLSSSTYSTDGGLTFLNITGTCQLLTLNNNRYVDNSSNQFLMTPTGSNISIQPFSPFYPTRAYTQQIIGGSGYFDGTGDYLTVPYSSVFDIPLNGQATFECWVYTGSSSAGGVMAGRNWSWGGGGPTWGFMVVSGVTPRWAIAGTGSATYVLAQSTISGTLNSWNHYVFTRDSSNVVRIFVNGVLGVARTDGQAMTSTSGDVFIGIASNLNAGSTFNGQMSNLRFIKGSVPTDYQTSSTTVGAQIFNPPAAPLTRTSQGAVSSDVALLLNFTNAGIVDSTAKNNLETVGNAQISTTQSKFGGSSLAFDGTGDWLLLPHSPDQFLSTGQFTIEMWIYRNASGTYGLVGKGTGTTGWLVSLNSSNQVVFTYGSSTITSTGTISATTWTYIAVVREGTGTNQTKIYISGSNDGTGTVSTDFNQTNAMYVGADRTGGSAFNGYIDDLRITRFARYTGNFTPQTSQWQDE